MNLAVLPQAGDDEVDEAVELPSFEEIYRSYANYVAGIGLKLLGRRGEIEDFVQEVFIEVHKSLDSLREPKALKSWIITISVRKARSKLRYRRVRSFVGIDTFADYDRLVDPNANSEENVMISEVYRALDMMPTDVRLAWTLRFAQGESLERVAELSDCSLATAKRRIAKAKAILKKGLGYEA